MNQEKSHSRTAGRLSKKVVTLLACTTTVLALLQGCGATQIDHRGHVFTDVDLEQVQTGMSKDQVRLALGTPDTTGTVDGDVYYYISSTQRTRPLGRPETVDRKILAIYFNRQESVAQVANYGMQDGVIFDFIKGETPSRGRQLTALQQIFGNIANRRSLLKDDSGAVPGTQGATPGGRSY